MSTYVVGEMSKVANLRRCNQFLRKYSNNNNNNNAVPWIASPLETIDLG